MKIMRTLKLLVQKCWSCSILNSSMKYPPDSIDYLPELPLIKSNWYYCQGKLKGAIITFSVAFGLHMLVEADEPKNLSYLSVKQNNAGGGKRSFELKSEPVLVEHSVDVSVNTKMSALCPVCNLTLPLSQIESHVNAHFDGDVDEIDPQIERDHHLALQLAASFDPSPSSSSSSHFDDSLGLHINFASLVHSQTKSPFYSVGHGGLISLLKKCLESELILKSKPVECSTSLLAGYVDHFQASKEDKGWGCGWKNIQMQCSHLLSHREEVRRVLFGGSNYVPDIPSLQRWLELAWNNGFDVSGAHQFNNQIYGCKRWIGTTECAALLRSFGLKARIVDFAPKKSESMYLSVPGSAIAPKRKSYGPMDRFVICESEPEKPVDGDDSRGSSNPSRIISKAAVLMNWVWGYFSDDRLNVSSGVHMTNKAPLYFQHEGHSRTIVGIQRRLQGTTFTPQYNLLILDPSDNTIAIEKALLDKRGWEKYLKRGSHTLKCPEYQVLYVDNGIADGDELEQLKTIVSHFVEF